jgi:hypothetical protein
MKIIFITGSLEQGRNGVGDYTRKLACEIIRLGHHVQIVALHDEHVNEVNQVNQFDNNIQIKVIRIPASFKLPRSIDILQKLIDHYDPDWLSLQYVSFSFDKRGLPFWFNKHLKKVSKGRRWNIMFHELWCGMNVNAALKERILGAFQKYNIQNLINELQPETIFTSINSYKAHLEKMHVKANVIPIFGNITLGVDPTEPEWNKFIKDAKIDDVITHYENWLIIGFFGTIYPNTGLKELLEKIQFYANLHRKKVAITIIGHNRTSDLSNLLTESGDLKIFRTGLLKDEVLNKVLRMAHAGILTTPADGINKSGSAVAWIERDVPLLICGDDASFNPAEVNGLKVYKINKEHDLEQALSSPADAISKNRLLETAEKYIESFKLNNK